MNIIIKYSFISVSMCMNNESSETLLYWILWGIRFWNSFSTDSLHLTASFSTFIGKKLMMQAEDMVVLFRGLDVCNLKNMVFTKDHSDLFPTLWNPIRIVLSYYLNIDSVFSTW